MKQKLNTDNLPLTNNQEYILMTTELHFFLLGSAGNENKLIAICLIVLGKDKTAWFKTEKLRLFVTKPEGLNRNINNLNTWQPFPYIS